MTGILTLLLLKDSLMQDAEYCAAAARTESLPTETILERFQNPTIIRCIHAILGKLTELGELADQFKKHLFYGKDLDIVNVQEEIGDDNWYTAILCNVFHLDWAKIKEQNIEKLKARFPKDKFESEHALFRNLEQERETLEQHTSTT